MDDARLRVLESQVVELRRQMKHVCDWHNTLRSRWWWRLWWFVQGYRMHTLGTWYVAPWNRAAADRYNKALG